MYRYLVMAFAICIAGVAALGQTQQQGTTTFSNDVMCQWKDIPAKPNESPQIELTCSGGLSLSGDSTSSVTIQGLKHPKRVVVDSGDKRRLTTADLLDLDSDVVHVTVHKTRWLWPTFAPVAGSRTMFNAFKGVIPDTSGKDIAATAVEHISEVDHPKLTVAVTDRRGKADEPPITRTFEIPVQFEAWRLESGGIYAYAWAHDQQIVKTTVTPAAATGLPALARVVAIRRGDEFGPSTGVAFNFHPANYPWFGWEFGTAVRGSADYAFFIGPTLRLLRVTDHALVTIGTGISLVKVTEFPGIVAATLTDVPADFKKGDKVPAGFYVADDPLLSGRTHYARRPYVSLGLSLTFDSIKK